MKSAGKGQSMVGTKFPSFPESRRIPGKGTVPPRGKMPATGVKGGQKKAG